jgi:hypothetical protein
MVRGSPSVEQSVVAQTLNDVGSKDVGQLRCRVLRRDSWDGPEHEAQYCK